jgi:hypothetical protein
MPVTTGTIFNSLKPTLDKVISDTIKSKTSTWDYKKWVDTKKMSDYWIDVLEMAGPGLMKVKGQTQEMAAGEIREGYRKRFTAITYGLQLVISQEAVEDNKYPEAVRLSKRLVRSAEQTKDILLTGMLVNAWNSSNPIGDGLSLFNANHLLADGDTFSNMLSTPATPSVSAYNTVRSACRVLPDHQGIRDGQVPMRILCPVEQEGAWEEIIFSKRRPESGNFSAINIANRDLAGNKDVIIPLRFWDNTSTNWCMQTDADDGACLYERKKLKHVSWVDAGHQSLHEGVTCRFDFGVVDARSFYGSGA